MSSQIEETTVISSCEAGAIPRKLSIRSAAAKRPVTICLQQSAILPLLCLAVLVLLQVENIRWAVRGIITQLVQQKKFKYDLPVKDKIVPVRVMLKSWDFWRFVLLAATSVFPIFYNHDMLFMYLNDNWNVLLAVQIFFTLGDNVCLICRWTGYFWEFRLICRCTHVYFNIMQENQKFSIRNQAFLLDDVVAIVDMYICHRKGIIKLRKKMLYAAIATGLLSWLAMRLAVFWQDEKIS